jgi:hypothetical protein
MGRTINFIDIKKNDGDLDNLSNYPGESEAVLKALIEWLRYNRENLNDNDANSLLSLVDQSSGYIEFINLEEVSKISKNVDPQYSDRDEFINPFEDPDEYTDEKPKYTFYEVLEKYKDFLIKNKLYGLRSVILQSIIFDSDTSREFLNSWKIVKNFRKTDLGRTLSYFLGKSASEGKTFVIESEDGCSYYEDEYY